jgi:hypothetical protein
MQTYEIHLVRDDRKEAPIRCRAASVGAVLKRLQPLVAMGRRVEIWQESRCLFDGRFAAL